MTSPTWRCDGVHGPGRPVRSSPAAGDRSGLVVALAVCVAISGAAGRAEENVLSPEEARGGWKLLFDGRSTDGWRNYRKEAISAGWQVKDGALVRAAAGAGDIVTADTFGFFELSLDYKIAPGGNSGIMFRVTEDQPAPWHSGPEVQVLDNAAGKDPQRAGWLYQLYPPGKDQATGAPLDATRPAGEWNTILLRVGPEQGEVYVNGLRYSQFRIGSEDWQKRVAASKFAKFPGFGTAEQGHICLQDHGDEVAYRNVKIRALPRPDAAAAIVDGVLPVGHEPAFPGIRWAGYEPLTADGRANSFRPIVLTHAGDGSGRIFVATQHGQIHVVRPGATESTLFADLSDRVVYQDRQNEEGFLGLAFHPRFRDNGQFFVYYTSARKEPHTSVISRFRVSPDAPDRFDAAFEEEVMVIPQPFWNHNGGTLCFGPDGCLYVALGDGGAANDPLHHGQNPATLLGKILRIDVDRHDPGLGYAIPPDNPLVGVPGARGEIWAWGLRNPWRIAFDPPTGRLWCADVGQNLFEEIDLIERGGNYGWSLREGRHGFGALPTPPGTRLVEPIFEYDHGVGLSITGGHVHRGASVPALLGKYLYADYVSGKLFALSLDEATGRAAANHAIESPKMPVISFGADGAGESYFLIVSGDGQGIYRLTAK